MPRTLDEIIEGYQGARGMMYGPTPLPPTTLLSTPPPSAMLHAGMPPPMMYSPAMMSMQSPAMFSGMTPRLPSMATTQQDLIARAMPQPIPMPQMPQLSTQQMAMMAQTPMPASMPTPMLRSTPGATGQFADPSSADAYRMLGRTAGYLDPSQAGSYANQQWGQKVERWGQTAGAVASMVPGVGMVTGIGMSLAGGPLFNNPLTRAVFGPSERAAQHMSMMANIQHRTFGNLQLTGGDVGLGGAGMSMPAAMQLGQQFTAKAESWGHVRGAKTEDVNKYKQDLVRMTEMAGQVGLLDASTNIDQISDTVMKLMKVMGRMAKLTGDPDFRNNLQQIGQLRTMGLSIDQAVETTRNLAFYARGAGVSQQQLLQQGGMQGAQAWAQAGLASGVGIGHGAMAQARARQFAGVLDPYTEQIMGGREGIQQKLTGMGAQFAAGPAGQLIMGATMGFNAQGELTTDTGKFQSMMNRGMNMSQLASESMRNFHRVVEEASQRHGISRTEAQSQVLEKQQALISQMASDPEQLQMMQLGTYGMLRKGGLNMTAAAFGAGGQTMEGATLIKQLASDPTIRERMRVQLTERLGALRKEARQHITELREQRDELRSSREWNEVPLIGDIRKWRRGRRHTLDVKREREADELAREQAELQDEESGTSSTYVGRTNERILEEFRQAERRGGGMRGFVEAGAGGLGEYGRSRAFAQQPGQGAFFGRGMAEAMGSKDTTMSLDLMKVAQLATGEREGFLGGLGAWWQRKGYGVQQLFGGSTAAWGPTGEAAASYWRGEERGYQRVIENTLALSGSIEAAQGKTMKDVSRSMDMILGEVTKAGGDPKKARGRLHALGSAIMSEMEASVKGGDKSINRGKMHERIKQYLIGEGQTPAQAEKNMKKFAKNWDDWAMNYAQEFGSDDVKIAMSATMDISGQMKAEMGKMTKEQLQTRFDDAKKAWEKQLHEAGITADEGLSSGEEQAMDVLKNAVAGSDEEAAAMLLAAESETGDTETKKRALQELQKLETEGKGDLVATAKKKMKRLGSEGRSFLGRFGKLAAEEDRTAEGYARQFKGRRHKDYGGKTQISMGAFGGAFLGADVTMGGEALGARVQDGKLVFDQTSGAGTKAGEEIKKVEDQLKGLGQIAKDFPDATKELKIAALGLQAAAKGFGSKIDGVMERQRAESS